MEEDVKKDLILAKLDYAIKLVRDEKEKLLVPDLIIKLLIEIEGDVKEY